MPAYLDDLISQNPRGRALMRGAEELLDRATTEDVLTTAIDTIADRTCVLVERCSQIASGTPARVVSIASDDLFTAVAVLLQIAHRRLVGYNGAIPLRDGMQLLGEVCVAAAEPQPVENVVSLLIAANIVSGAHRDADERKTPSAAVHPTASKSEMYRTTLECKTLAEVVASVRSVLVASDFLRRGDAL